MKRVTIACGDEILAAANHGMVMLGKAQQINSYSAATYQDAAGNLYAVSSGWWTDAQIFGVQDPLIIDALLLSRPEMFAPDGLVDEAIVRDLQGHVTLWSPVLGEGGPAAQPGKLIGVISEDAMQALDWLGVSPVPVEDDG